ncbi:hypothetical protein [Streptomyces virginiae]|uniref:hypothetical protein n=1 Tax=Streptomyces virginiae TaxID=1961 RepID=UPI0033254C69
MSSHSAFLPGRRPKPSSDGTIPLPWLIAQWPESEDEAAKENLPVGMPTMDLVRLTKSRWRTGHDCRELQIALGLEHFEGRAFNG